MNDRTTTPSNKASDTDDLAVVIVPALNEAASITEVVNGIPRHFDGVSRVEIVVVDDGSTDDTATLARAAGADVISHPFNRGVGAALQTGLEEARRRGARIAINIDADGQFNPADIPKLAAPILEGTADFTTASRFINPAFTPQMPWIKREGNYLMARLISTVCGRRYADVTCGFRAYGEEALLRLVLLGQFTYTQESFVALSFAGLRILEVPLPVRGVREHGQSRVASNIPRYAWRSGKIIFSIVRDFRPGRFFNVIAGFATLLALALGGFFFGHYLETGSFSPHLWAGFLAAFSLGVGLLLFFMGQTAEMLARLRMVQEQQLYLLRRQVYLNRHPASRVHAERSDSPD